MPTVVPRFEPSRTNGLRGSVYYRIYYGHNRRMEFSSGISIASHRWDKAKGMINGEDDESAALRKKIAADITAIKKILETRQAQKDVFGTDYAISDVVAEFKEQKKKHDSKNE